MPSRIFSLSALVGMSIALLPSAAQTPSKVTIGIVPSMTSELSVSKLRFISDEFPQLVKDFTGFGGDLDKAASEADLADKLTAGKDQFGVFQGIEFAQIQAKHPQLRPLLLSIYRSPEVKAILVVKKDSAAAKADDLKGKEVALLKEGKEHIRLFAAKESGGELNKFFSKVTPMTSSENALDAILFGKVQGAIVDKAGLDIYREVNPGKFNRLKVIAESPVFPPSVIAYDPKQVDAAVAKQFKDGMLAANKSAKGREVMANFMITSFEPVPEGFQSKLDAIRKEFPK